MHKTALSNALGMPKNKSRHVATIDNHLHNRGPKWNALYQCTWFHHHTFPPILTPQTLYCLQEEACLHQIPDYDWRSPWDVDTLVSVSHLASFKLCFHNKHFVAV